MICFTYIPSIITIILPFTSEWNFKEVSAFTYLEHPTYNLTIYEPIIGFYNIYSFQFIAATFLLIFGAYAVPTISGLLTHRVINLINANQSMSPKTKEQSKTLAYGLGCQTFLPVVCYIPLPTLYIISQMFKVEVLLTELYTRDERNSVFRLPSSVFRLPSSVFRLPSSVFRLPSS
uniref:Uncharacterized protein n=1 Tax=Caenorhabditis japonica TaxID=281687 RepID=A0A8R1DLH2_CAEJA